MDLGVVEVVVELREEEADEDLRVRTKIRLLVEIEMLDS